MNLMLRPLTPQNRKALLALWVAKQQENFIESVEQCLTEAKADEHWQPIGIYDGDQPVGFAMTGFFEKEYPIPLPPRKLKEGLTFCPQPGRVWLDRFLIDAQVQGRGYGKAALDLLLRKLQAQYPGREIYLSVYPENTAAIRLYQKFGFQFIEEKDIHGETVMVCYPQ